MDVLACLGDVDEMRLNIGRVEPVTIVIVSYNMNVFVMKTV